MPRVTTQQTNFTAGEISPRLIGRTDIDRYANAAAVMLNAYPVIHGGAKRRDGTLFVSATKDSGARASRLVPFVFSRDDAYMLEFGHQYVRAYKNGARLTGVEIPSPYTEAMLWDVDFVQGADTMFLAHPNVPIQRLRRFSDTLWDLSAAAWTTEPFDEQGHAPAVALTLSSAAVGAGRTATAASAAFLPTDVGRILRSGAGTATVTGYTSSTAVTVTITIAFADTAIASGAWALDASPQALLAPSDDGPVASSITLWGALTRAAGITLTGTSGAITIGADAAVFVAGDTGKVLYADSGRVTLTYVTATQCTGTTSADFASQSYASGGWGITAGTWRASDVGSHVRVNGGLCKITAVGVDTAATAAIVNKLDSTVAAPPLAWSVEGPVWTAANGYPRTVTLHEQRLIAAGSPAKPQTIWGSTTGEYLNFTPGTDDTSAYTFTLAADEINPISYVAPLRNLVVHTYGGEFSLQGGVEKPITPTNVRIRPESAHGSKGVRPVTVGKESIFVQRAGRKVRAMGYRYDSDGYVCPDLTVLAEHITTSGIVQLAYQQEPDQLLWGVRADGTLLSCTLDRDQNVTGWAPHYTAGAVESVATIPAGEREQTWLIVRRTVNSATVRYVERIDETWEPLLLSTPTGYPPLTPNPVWGCTMDSAVSTDSPAGTSTITGLDHLEGCTVCVLADGAVQPDAVVAGGQITLARTAHRVLVGLPFVTRITLLTPEVGTGTGTAQGNSMRTSELTLRFLNTLGAQVMDDEGNAQEIPFRQFGLDVLDQPPEARTSNVRIETLGWARGSARITVMQTQPLPMHLLAAIRKFQVND